MLRRLKNPFKKHNTISDVMDSNSSPSNADLHTSVANALLEENMLFNIKRMSSERAEDVMIPRVDIVSVEENMSLDEIIEIFREFSLTRMPVYREALDNPVGFIHFKDLALYYGFASVKERQSFKLSTHVRKMLYVPPSMLAGTLMQRMQTLRIHMALVIDEFGGVDGLVTIEDLVERVVGDIEDEHDDLEPPQWQKVSDADNVYLCDARTPIEDFEKEIGHTLRPEDWEEEVDTLGGLVFRMCGRVPERNEIVIHENGNEFEIIDADPRRIKKIRLTLKSTFTDLDVKDSVHDTESENVDNH